TAARVSACNRAPIAVAAKNTAVLVEAPGIEPSRSEGRERRWPEKQALYRPNASFDAPPWESLSVRFRPCRATVWGTIRGACRNPGKWMTPRGASCDKALTSSDRGHREHWETNRT